MTPRPRWQRAVKNRGFLALCIAATSFSCITLAVLMIALMISGVDRLTGFDAEGRDEAMQPQPPVTMDELDEVDWPTAAADLAMPELARLERVDFGREGDALDLEYSDEAGDLPWAVIAARDDLDAAALFAELDWYELSESLTVPGMGWLKATWLNSHIGHFVNAPPSRRPADAGIGPALFGTMWICVVCAAFALPIGVGTAVFLEEYRPRHHVTKKLHSFVQLNITNLAGVPSIVYGIIGLTAFVQMFGLSPREPAWTIGTPEDFFYFRLPFGRGVLAGGMTLMLVILPVVIISSQEALRAVPDSLRQGSLALGATRWQMIRRMTLPAAIPGIMTGAILAMSRAIGEAAPVLIICGIVFIRFTPHHLMDEFTALPLQIYDWAGRPQEAFHAIAASGILVLLLALLSFNALAILVRQRFQRPLQ